MVGETKKAIDISAKVIFGNNENGESLSDHPFSEEVSWLQQFVPTAKEDGFYLVECVNVDSPEKIWHGQRNHILCEFECVYEG